MIIKKNNCLGCLPGNPLVAWFVIWSLLVASPVQGVAAEQPDSGQTEDAPASTLPVEDVLQDLLQVLDQETELATRTKMNIDFVPGMVSVLHGRDLLARGKRTVYDALELIPGVELSKSIDGQLQVIVRGVGKTYSSGKVKFLLNGAPFNTTLSAVSTALVIPLEFVDRIEVIRGPGSVIYGEFASIGVINIITNKEKTNDEVFTRLGSEGHSYTVGGQLHQDFDDGKSSMTVSFSQYETDGNKVQSGPDLLTSIPVNSAISNSPGDVNDAELDRTFVLGLDVADYNISWQFIERGFGDYFGISGALSSDSSKILRTLSMQTFEVGRPWQISEDLSSRLKVGWSNYVLDSDEAELFPPGYIYPPTMTSFPDGVVAAPNYVEDKYYMDFEAEYKGIEEHDLLFGVEASRTQQGETFARRNYNVTAGGVIVPAPNQIYTGTGNWLAEGLKRRVIGLYAQDQYSFTNKLMFTGGFRYDDYDDIGGDFTPRIAAVYQYSDVQTFKAQYAQSFRPPTFLEMNIQNNAVVMGNPDLKSEQLDSFELGYIFNNGVTITRATAFWYDLKNLIALDTSLRTYTNKSEIQARGAELEYVKQLNNKIKFDSNISYIDAKLNSGGKVPGVASVLGNAGVLWQPLADYAFAAQLRYVGSRAREPGDSRPTLKGFTTLDLTANAYNILLRGLTVRGIVGNVFNEAVKYPSFLVNTPSGQVPIYRYDNPQSERTYEVQAMYEF
jgi:outer membrane receptor for ferrienterochelin and colicins